MNSLHPSLGAARDANSLMTIPSVLSNADAPVDVSVCSSRCGPTTSLSHAAHVNITTDSPIDVRRCRIGRTPFEHERIGVSSQITLDAERIAPASSRGLGDRLESGLVEDADLMAINELHDALAFEPAAGPDHGLERQPQVVGDVRFAHRHRDVAANVCGILFPQQLQQHGEPAHGVATSHDDVVVLRLTQHVNRLACLLYTSDAADER